MKEDGIALSPLRVPAHAYVVSLGGRRLQRSLSSVSHSADSAPSSVLSARRRVVVSSDGAASCADRRKRVPLGLASTATSPIDRLQHWPDIAQPTIQHSARPTV